MDLKYCKFLIGAALSSVLVSGCAADPQGGQSQTASETNTVETNIINAMLPPSATNAQAADARRYLETYLKTNSAARHYFESLMPEVEKREHVRQAIKNAVATNTDPKVLAFHEFLSHWHLQWPVVKEGAFGEGGMGFAWNKDLHKFQGTVDATAIIEDRYVLQIILDCEVGEDFKVVTFTNLRFSFEEVKDIRVRSGGGYAIRFDSQNGKRFGLKEWQQLKEGNWDFSKIGINIISNAPIPNLRQAFE